MRTFPLFSHLFATAMFLCALTAAAQQVPAPPYQQIYDTAVAELNSREQYLSALVPEEADDLLQALITRYDKAQIVAIVEVLLAMAPTVKAGRILREAAIRAVPEQAAVIRAVRASRFVFLTHDGVRSLGTPWRLPFASVDLVQDAGHVVSPADAQR